MESSTPGPSAAFPPVPGPCRLGCLGGLDRREVTAVGVFAAAILSASHWHWWLIGIAEAWAFATGFVCVWLVVREHLWNWPIGLVNNVLFFGLFYQSRLFADMGLQVVYFGLGVYGWWNWRFGGRDRSELTISRTTRAEWLVLLGAIPLATWGLRELLIHFNGAAPFWDAFTTVLCLAAQYLLGQKRIENWLLWMVADVIYIPLYASRDLPLTAVLYALFLILCGCGLRAWARGVSTGEGRR